MEGLEDVESDTGQNRTDRYTFRYVSGDLTGLLVPDVDCATVQWIETPSQTHKAVARVPDYVRVSAEEVTIRASVTLYDQYGNGHRTGSGQQVGITIGGQALECLGKSIRHRDCRCHVGWSATRCSCDSELRGGSRR